MRKKSTEDKNNLRKIVMVTDTRELYRRQIDLFDPNSFEELCVHVFGCGSIGSFTTIALAKLGIHNIVLYDFDQVELHNVSNQFFREQDVGSSKTFAVERLARDFSPTVRTINKEGKIDNDTELQFNDNDIIVLAFDNLQTRKIVYEKALASGKKLSLIDGRMGGELLRVYVIKDLSKNDYYERSLTTEVEHVICSARSICYNGITISGIISSIVKKIIMKQKVPSEINFSLNNFDFFKED